MPSDGSRGSPGRPAASTPAAISAAAAIEKAVGWALREAGKADMPRLERYLRANGRSTPRTTLRYAIERFPERKRRALLVATRERRTPNAERRTTDRQPYGS
jgi:hypothetical protein